MKLTSKARASVAALALAGGVVAGTVQASAASASTSCPSTGEIQYSSKPFYDNSHTLAAVAYIMGYSNGTVCAYLMSQGSYYGEAKYMSIELIPDFAGNVTDSGNYYDYAGPVSAGGGWLCATSWVVMHYPSGAGMIDASGPDLPCD